MGDLRWVPDPHRADTTDLRDAAGGIIGWVAPVRGRWRGVACAPGPDLSPYVDHPDEPPARAWVEAQVAARSGGSDG